MCPPETKNNDDHQSLVDGYNHENPHPKRRLLRLANLVAFGSLFAMSSLKALRHGSLAIKIGYQPDRKNETVQPGLQIGANADYKPQFILNIGPPKTGSTTLQCELMQNTDLLDRFSPYRYIGKWKTKDCEGPMHNFSYAITHLNNGVGTVESLEEMLNVVSSHLQDDKSPIFSQETLSTIMIRGEPLANDNLHKLVSSLKDKGFATKIVASYRRYFDWVPSYYRNHAGVMLEANQINFISFMKMAPCFESFQSYLEHIDLCQRSWPVHRMKMHPIQMILQAANGILNQTVDVINLHDNDAEINDPDGTTKHASFQFANKALEYSNDFQHELLLGHAQLSSNLHTSSDQRIETEYIHLVVKLYEKELVTKLPPKNLWKWLQKMHPTIEKLYFDTTKEKSYIDGDEVASFPEKCLDKSLQNQLLELSLQFEKQLYPEWSKLHEEDHRDAFEKFANGGKYCQWDGEAVLANEAVANFIREAAAREVEEITNGKL